MFGVHFLRIFPTSRAMGLYEFRDNTFLEYKGYWFVWEAAWDAFRPIQNVVWTGSSFRIVDTQFCSDPTDELYGYGSESMLKLCELLRDTRTRPATPVESLPIGVKEWFRDRFVAMDTCAPRTSASWKKLVQGRGRTCRKAPRGKKFTRRNRRTSK
jgi:hypothetical protein